MDKVNRPSPDPIEQFDEERRRIRSFLAGDSTAAALTRSWMNYAQSQKYSYQFDWLSRPIIQYPQDIVAMQEIIWRVKPDLIVETGIAHGGSLIFSASMLALLDLCEASEIGRTFDPRTSRRKVIGIDIDIREHNRDLIRAHPLAPRIEMLQGPSTAAEIVSEVRRRVTRTNRVLVCLDSNHTYDHVLAELEAYAPLTSPGSYCVVFDTVVADMPTELFRDRPWGPANNPKMAVQKYLECLERDGRSGLDGQRLRLEVDRSIESRLLVTVAPGGYLRRV
jgi:cephalosporin hydroxylase